MVQIINPLIFIKRGHDKLKRFTEDRFTNEPTNVQECLILVLIACSLSHI